MWPELCEIQHNSPSKFTEQAFRESLRPPNSLSFRYVLTLPETYSEEMPIAVAWRDLRVSEEAQNQLLNQVTLNSSFVEVPNVCNQ